MLKWNKESSSILMHYRDQLVRLAGLKEVQMSFDVLRGLLWVHNHRESHLEVLITHL